MFFGEVAFSEYFLYHYRFIFVWRARRTFPPSGLVFFYLVPPGWVFDISSLLCENSINQINQILYVGCHWILHMGGTHIPSIRGV